MSDKHVDRAEDRPVYFAHSISDYGTEFEAGCIERLSSVFPIENPNQPRHQAGYAAASMGYFTDNVLPICGGCVFVRLPSGWLGAGVAMEVDNFLHRGLPVWELSADGTTLTSVKIHPDKRLSRDETRGATRVLSGLPNGGRP